MASWTDAAGNLWLFGGVLSTAKGNTYLADLWKFDGVHWTWVSGSSALDAPGVWGTMGVADPGNLPSGRLAGAFASDASGNFWLCGGQGTDGSGTSFGFLNDLWKFDGTNWTWMAGSNSLNPSGVVGTQGVPASGNTPPSGTGFNAWVDAGGHFWLFGGGTNLLWKFDGINWTWILGSPDPKVPGSYGTLGVAAASNLPPPRLGATRWIDSSGLIWIYGGNTTDSTGSIFQLDDLWRLDGTLWTWMSGSANYSQLGSYGSQGVPSASNLPGCRVLAVGWADAAGNLWLFGGNGKDSLGNSGYLNDLWRYDGAAWTWMAGSDLRTQPGVYGTLGTAGPGNAPGARVSSAVWKDPAGGLWLFGGYGDDAGGTSSFLGDVWRYNP